MTRKRPRGASAGAREARRGEAGGPGFSPPTPARAHAPPRASSSGSSQVDRGADWWRGNSGPARCSSAYGRHVLARAPAVPPARGTQPIPPHPKSGQRSEPKRKEAVRCGAESHGSEDFPPRTGPGARLPPPMAGSWGSNSHDWASGPVRSPFLSSCSNPGFVPLRDTRELPKSIPITIIL